MSAFGSGFTTSEACEAAGIAIRAFMAWKVADKTFAADLKKTRQQRRLSLLNRIRIAANDPKYWTAAARLLEFEFPETYGRRESFDAQSQSILLAAIARLNNGGATGAECVGTQNAERSGDAPARFDRKPAVAASGENDESH